MRNESTSVEQQVEVLVKANGQVPLLYHLLRDNPNKRALFESAMNDMCDNDVESENFEASAIDSSSNAERGASRKRKR